MNAYFNNLGLHVATATAKANRRLDRAAESGWPYALLGCASALVGFIAVTAWLS